MADNPTSTGDRPPAPSGDAVARSLGGAYWSVDGHRWERLLPDLPDDLVDLLAPPIVVGAVPLAAG